MVAYAEQPPDKVYLTQENIPLYNDEEQRTFRVFVSNCRNATRPSEALNHFLEALNKIPGSSGDNTFSTSNTLEITPDHDSVGGAGVNPDLSRHSHRWLLGTPNCCGSEKNLLNGPLISPTDLLCQVWLHVVGLLVRVIF